MSDALNGDQEHTLVAIGELLWDCLPCGRQPGGAPANVVFHAGQLGLPGLIGTCVGSDAGGAALIDYLADHGLSHRLIQRDPDRPTGTVSVGVGADGEPNYTIHENAAWDAIDFTPELQAACETAKVLCFGTLAQRSAKSRSTIRRAIEAARSATKLYDVNLRPPFYERMIIDASLCRADVVKLNCAETTKLACMFDIDAREPTMVGRELIKRFDVQLVVVTRGAAGCMMVESGSLHEEAGGIVDAVDVVGAGDAFTAGLACGLIHSWPLDRTARIANGLGGLVAGRHGAMPSFDAGVIDALLST